MQQMAVAKRSAPGWVEVTGSAAALSAALIHSAAVGPHSGQGVMPVLFAVAAIVGFGSGVAFLLSPGRLLLVAVAGCHLGMVATWAASRTTGVGFVDGLADPEAVGFPDTAAAAFATVVVGCISWMLLRPRALRVPRRVAVAGYATIVTAALMIAGPALHAAATDVHPHRGEAEEVVTAEPHEHDAAAPTGAATDTAPGPATDTASHDTASHDAASHDEPKPYDPTAPIDLSGTPGVTEVQQKQAELLLAETLAALPKYADQAVAYADGYRSIGDSVTGYEHYLKWSAINDDVILDPEHPESLVYATGSVPPKLVAAMYVLPSTYTLDNVPNIGGSLIQWHIHDDLCFTKGEAPVVAGVTSVGGTCSGDLQKFQPSPMIHVWIVENPCGPFAALEGIGAGQTRDGTRACDHAHGSAGPS